MTYSKPIATYLELLDQGYERCLAAQTAAFMSEMSIQSFLVLYFKAISH